MAAGQIVPIVVDGEARIRDVDLGRRLGFDRPRKIRDLIARYGADLDRLGKRPMAERVGRGGTAVECFLNRKQAIFITAKSETEAATDITIEIIERFDAYERGLPVETKQIAELAEIRQMIVAQNERIERLMLGYDHRVSVTEFILPGEILTRLGVKDKKQRSKFGWMCANQVKSFCIENRRHNDMRRSNETDKWRFSEDVVALWIAAVGRTWIKARLDQGRGQGVLRLVPPEK